MKNGHIIELPGLDGANPLGFLTALGVLRTLHLKASGMAPALSWAHNFRARLHIHNGMSSQELSAMLLTGLRAIVKDGVSQFGDIIGVSSDIFGKFVSEALTHFSEECNRNKLLFASAFGSDAIKEEKKDAFVIVPTFMSFSNGQGGKLLLKDFRTLVSHLNAERLNAALFQPWDYQDRDKPTFRWDPNDMRMGAHMATDPGSTETRSVAAANALAFVGMSFLTVAPSANGKLLTTGFRRIEEVTYFTWPLWNCPIGADVVACLLQQKKWPKECGIIACFGSKRVMFKKNLYLDNAVAMDGSFPRS